MKKLLLILVIIALTSTAAYAAPLTNFNLGALSLDASFDYNNSSLSVGSVNGTTPDVSKLNGWAPSFDFAATAGLIQANWGGLAVQIKNGYYLGANYTPNLTSMTNVVSGSINTSVNKTEYNLIYQFNNLPITAQLFAGMDYVSAGVSGNVNSPFINSSVNFNGGVTSFGYQIGATLDYPINNQFQVFGGGQYGNLDWGLNIGVSYSPMSNVDLNLGVKYDSFNINNMLPSNVNVPNSGSIALPSITSAYTTPYLGVTLHF